MRTYQDLHFAALFAPKVVSTVLCAVSTHTFIEGAEEYITTLRRWNTLSSFIHLINGGAWMSGFWSFWLFKFSILTYHRLLPLNGIIIESSTQGGPVCFWPALEAAWVRKERPLNLSACGATAAPYFISISVLLHLTTCNTSFCHHPLSVDREEPWSMSAFCVYSGAFHLVLSDLSRAQIFHHWEFMHQLVIILGSWRCYRVVRSSLSLSPDLTSRLNWQFPSFRRHLNSDLYYLYFKFSSWIGSTTQ